MSLTCLISGAVLWVQIVLSFFGLSNGDVYFNPCSNNAFAGFTSIDKNITDGDFTIQLWFKQIINCTNDDDNYIGLLSNRDKDDENVGLMLGFDSNGYPLVIYLNQSIYSYNSSDDSGGYFDNEWHQYVVTFNSKSSRLLIHIDGNIIGGDTVSYSSSIEANSDYLYIGADMAKLEESNLYQGYVKELAIWNDVLTRSYINNIYLDIISTKCQYLENDNLLYYYPMYDITSSGDTNDTNTELWDNRYVLQDAKERGEGFLGLRSSDEYLCFAGEFIDTNLSVIEFCSDAPTNQPTIIPSMEPTLIPSFRPSVYPTLGPSFRPSIFPTYEPTNRPSLSPSSQPSFRPSFDPTNDPTLGPTFRPSLDPSGIPTLGPTFRPSTDPSSYPTLGPTFRPSLYPTNEPTLRPSLYPTNDPTLRPSLYPTNNPSFRPSLDPTDNPTFRPSLDPTNYPTHRPSFSPSNDPTFRPSFDPTNDPTLGPTYRPSLYPSNYPTHRPSFSPSNEPTFRPSFSPSHDPTASPSFDPSSNPSDSPSYEPTQHPSHSPSYEPSLDPSDLPTLNPSYHPTHIPTKMPTFAPAAGRRRLISTPTYCPALILYSNSPTMIPTTDPTSDPTGEPTDSPVAEMSTTDDGYEYEFITYDDIGSVYFDSLSTVGALSNQFNPGYRNEFETIVEIELNTQEKINLFTDGEDLVSFDFIWNVYDKNTNDKINIDNIVEYNDKIITDDDVLKLTSYFIIDSNNVFSQYSVSSICDLFSNDIFQSGNEYEFENILNITLRNNNNGDDDGDIAPTTVTSIQIGESVTLKATHSPKNGQCISNPSSGVTLIDTFNLTCNSWINGNSNDTTNLEYGFIFGSSLFLKQYDDIEFVSTVLTETQSGSGYANITAVIIDTSTDAAVCQPLNIEISSEIDDILDSLIDGGGSSGDENSTTNTGSPNIISNITDILIEIVEDLDVSDIAVIAAYEVYDEYLETVEEVNETINVEDVNQEIADFQSDLIELYLNSTIGDILGGSGTTSSANGTNGTSGSNLNITTEQAASVLYLLSEITDPLIDDDTDTFVKSNASNSSNVYYEESLIVDILEITETFTNVIAESDDPVTEETATSVVQVLSNTVELRTFSNESADTSVETGQTTVDIAVTVTESLLTDLIPGESIVIETDTMTLESTKISVGLNDICGNNTIQLSDQLLLQRSSNGSDFMDCSILQTNNNLYAISSQSLTSSNNSFIGNYLNIDITNSNSSASNNGAYGNLDECEPIILTIDITSSAEELSLNNPNWYPNCIYFNETSGTFENDGCIVLHSSDTSVECACVHTTFYGASERDFVPRFNYTVKDLYKRITFTNVINHPLGWIVSLSWIVVCVFLIYLCKKYKQSNNKQDKSLVIKDIDNDSHDLNFSVVSEDGLDIHKYRSLIEYDILCNQKNPNDEKYKIFKLWFVAIKNDHIWFGICFRDYGTNYSGTQRILVMMVRFLTTMAVSAVFYGVTQGSQIGDLSMAFLESMLGFIPMKFIEDFMKQYKPKKIENLDKNVIDLDMINSISHNEQQYQKIKGVSDADLLAMLRLQERPQQQPHPIGAVGAVGAGATAGGTALEIGDGNQPTGTTPGGPTDNGAITPGGDGQTNTTGAVGTTTSGALLGEKNSGDLLDGDERNDVNARGNGNGISGDEMNSKLEEADQDSDYLDNLIDDLLSDSSGDDDDDDEGAATPGDGQTNAPVANGSTASGALLGENVNSDDSLNDDADNGNDAHVNGDVVKGQGINSEDEWIALNSLLKQRVLNKLYKYPIWCRKASKIIAISWTIIAATIVTLFCIYFDVSLLGSNGWDEIISHSHCPSTLYDIPETTLIERNVTQEEIDILESQPNYTPYDPPDSDNLWKGDSTSVRFIYQILITYAISLFFTQPLILFLKSCFIFYKYKKNGGIISEATLVLDQVNRSNSIEMGQIDGQTDNLELKFVE